MEERTLAQAFHDDLKTKVRAANAAHAAGAQEKPKVRPDKALAGGDRLAMSRRAELVQLIADGREKVAIVQRQEARFVKELKQLGITREVEEGARKLGLLK